MDMKPCSRLQFACVLIAFISTCQLAVAQTDTPASKTPEIRTPPAAHTPHINGPGIFGVRPEHPFLYHIPAAGDRPMQFSVDNLPEGLKLDPKTGNITGAIEKPGDYVVTFHAKNALGANGKKFKIVVGETIDLTPAMGWNSWNHYARKITQDIVLQNAKAMADSGLIDHGWTYVNIDDTWQGKRGGEFHGLQGNEKFPDIKKLCDQIHAMGLSSASIPRHGRRPTPVFRAAARKIPKAIGRHGRGPEKSR